MYYPDNEDEKIRNDADPAGETEKSDGIIHPEDEMKTETEPAAETEAPTEETTADDIVTDDYTVKEETTEEPETPKEQYAPYEPYTEPPRYSAPEQTPEQPKKKKNGFFISGAAIAVLLVCLIVFVGVIGVGVWKISEYMNSPTEPSSKTEQTNPSSPSQGGSGTQTTPSSSGTTSVTPAGSSEMSGAAISPESTVTSDTTTAETDMIAKNIRSSVLINLYLGDTLTGDGSGVIYTTDGYIITNFHVVESVANGSRRAIVVLYDGSQYEATYVLGDMDRDIAVIKINKNDCEAVTIGNSDASVVGERIYAIGNPNGDGITVTEGIISAKNRTDTVRSTNITIKNVDMLIVTAPINAGNSGGGIFNAKGELVGIVNSKKYYDKSGNVTEGTGMAIPISRAVECINTLIENDGYIPGKAKLGVTVNIYGKTLTSGWNSITYCTCVTGLSEGGGAEAAGIEIGDIITAINGINLQQYRSQYGLMSDYDALHMILLDYAVGDTVTVTLLRPESDSSSAGGYQTVTYKEVTVELTFTDFNYAK